MLTVADPLLEAAHAAALAGAGPAWLRPYVARVVETCQALAEADGEAESAWRFGELVGASDELRVMCSAWLCERDQAALEERLAVLLERTLREHASETK